ncbi:MAG: acyl carrier protein [Firmicutes bacterium]|nr:acyl carrier protein [Bacillota bacterium]
MNKMDAILKEMVLKFLETDAQMAENIDENEDLSEYGFNSLRAMELVVNIEDEFGIELEDEDLLIDNLDTIAKLRIVVRKYVPADD